MSSIKASSGRLKSKESVYRRCGRYDENEAGSDLDQRKDLQPAICVAGDSQAGAGSGKRESVGTSR